METFRKLVTSFGGVGMATAVILSLPSIARGALTPSSGGSSSLEAPKSSFSISPGLGLSVFRSDVTKSQGTSIGPELSLRLTAEKRGFSVGLDGAVGRKSGIGAVTRNVVTAGLLIGTYNESIDGFFNVGLNYLAFTDYRGIEGAGFRVGIVKNLGDSFQLSAEGRLTFMHSKYVSNSTGSLAAYSSRATEVVFAILMPFWLGGPPTDRAEKLFEDRSRRRIP